ncbi:ras-related protein Rab-34 [Strongylocentrotus purpuratus]|uniref:Ras-related protein Rab-36 n=2 Tax=Strongylocentrotus purpuratus TaxID=7668 RepID=A0A7M7T1X4_STRPU|nr:ras-related protein Rab-34 [Strongylocentrotus purpuratus]
MRISQVARDRNLIKFPQPYKEETPYKERDFEPKVRDACLANKTGTVGLQVSKVIVVGDVSVGKTCLVNRFCHEVFDRDYKATIGVDFEVERFDVLGIPFNLQLWDTAGQERFKCIAAAYYRGAHVVVIVFDMRESYTLDHAKRWYQESLLENSHDPHIFLVGTKRDLCESHEEVQKVEEAAMEVAREIKAEYWSVSSLSGQNVEEFFNRLAGITFNASVLKALDDLEAKSASRQIAIAQSSENRIKLTPDDIDGGPGYKNKKAGCCN